MYLTSRSFVKSLLKNKGVYPSKRLGQNFLISENVLRKIIKAADIKKTDVVLEVGPGIGTLTKEIAKRAKKIIAIEKDKKMVEILKETLKNFDNVKIIAGDILKIENRKLKIENSYKIVANLPYYIASPVIKKFLETEPRPKEMVLMVQKEVAKRICAEPPNMSILSISVQFYAKPEIISFVSKNSFWPSPKVDSAIIKIIPRKGALVTDVDPLLFFKIVRAGFSHPRKTLANNLSLELKLDKEKIKSWLSKNKISPSQRAQNLSIEQWIKLTNTFQKKEL